MILRAKLNKLNLDLTIFTKHVQLFLKLQYRLYNILENTKHSKGTYFLMADLINNQT